MNSGARQGVKSQVGIIGYGRFGRLVARIIRSKFENVGIAVFTRSKQPGMSGGVEFASLDKVCGSQVIIPCVPISAFAEVIKSISGKLKPGALVVEVCSVKVFPVEVMSRYLPPEVEILATHPIFGPDSARGGLRGLRIVLHGVRVSPARYERIKQACLDIGLEVIEMSPEEHDRLMAFSMAYAHLVGRIGERMNLKNTPVDTRGFAQLMKVQKQVTNDRFTLFKDIQNYNPYAREMRQEFRQALAEIEMELSDGQKGGGAG